MYHPCKTFTELLLFIYTHPSANCPTSWTSSNSVCGFPHSSADLSGLENRLKSFLDMLFTKLFRKKINTARVHCVHVLGHLQRIVNVYICNNTPHACSAEPQYKLSTNVQQAVVANWRTNCQTNCCKDALSSIALDNCFPSNKCVDLKAQMYFQVGFCTCRHLTWDWAIVNVKQPDSTQMAWMTLNYSTNLHKLMALVHVQLLTYYEHMVSM